MTYSEKLKDPRWQKKRLNILNRDNWTCRWCGDTETTLHVHHLKYSGDPWEVSDSDLLTLCATCHEKESNSKRKYFEEWLLSELRKRPINDIHIVCGSFIFGGFDEALELMESTADEFHKPFLKVA